MNFGDQFPDRTGDFHLTVAAGDATVDGVAVAEPGLDLDGDPCTSRAPDLGADERKKKNFRPGPFPARGVTLQA
jgi:hypothetical protein